MKELNERAALNHQLQLETLANVEQRRCAMLRIRQRSGMRKAQQHSRLIRLDMALIGAMCMGLGVLMGWLL